MEKVAVRNIRLCTKDCLCLYVCPTGASDTENSIIDVNKCTGCGLCADACPSGAISLVPKEYPPQQPKTNKVKAALNRMAQNKADEEKLAETVAENSESDVLYRLMKAVSKSQRLVAEDIMREAGYMLPQSQNTHDLLKDLAKNPSTADAANKLLSMIECNESKPKKWVCEICGYVHEGDNPPEQCPVCFQKVFKEE